MTDDTEPNLRANTPRNLMLRGLAWCRAHPEHAIRGAIFAAGVLLGYALGK